jgi:hypothetical protein
MDPERKAAIRRSYKWVALGYVPLLGAVAWAYFAVHHWPGSRGGLLAASGAMAGAGAASLLTLPIFRVTIPTRRFMGMSFTTYLVVSTLFGLAVAAFLVVLAFATPQ